MLQHAKTSPSTSIAQSRSANPKRHESPQEVPTHYLGHTQMRGSFPPSSAGAILAIGQAQESGYQTATLEERSTEMSGSGRIGHGPPVAILTIAFWSARKLSAGT